MTAVEYLEKVKQMDTDLIHLRWQVQEVRTLAEKITAGYTEGMPRPTGVSDKVGNAAVKLVDLEAQLRDMEQEFIAYRMEVNLKLTELAELEYTVLKLRYIQYKKWSDIAEEMHYSEMTISRLHKRALDNLQRLLGA